MVIAVMGRNEMSDLIDRQAAIDAVNGLPDCPNGYSDTYDKRHIIAVLEDVPSVQPERWIPVEQELPEDGVTVWVTIQGHDVITCEDGETLEQAIARISKIRWVTQGYWSEEEHGWNDPSFGCPLMVQPVAWMPIDTPEPYKEGQDE